MTASSRTVLITKPAATANVEGPLGVRSIDARASDALNLAALTNAPVLVSFQVADDAHRWQEGEVAEARLLRSLGRVRTRPLRAR
jgi:bifunctional DNase/RNase